MKLAVVGTGYVGLVTGTCLADSGNQVVCIDIDRAKIDRLNRGEIPIYEPGLEECVARNRGRLTFSTNLADALERARLLFVAVGTAMPPSDRHALVMKSTVPVGTGVQIQRMFAEQDKHGFRYVSCPEFL